MGHHGFLGLVVPMFGSIIGSLMYASPLKAVKQARRDQHIGDLNPLPFAVTFACTSAWIAYGFASRDVFMFPPNLVGLPISLWNTVSCYGLAPAKVQDQLLALLTAATVLLPFLGVVSTNLLVTDHQRSRLWGYSANALTLTYYGAPLSAAWQVIRNKDSSSIYRPTCLMSLLNASLWSMYGLAVADMFISVPNIIGALLTVGQLLLCWWYPAIARVEELDRRPSSDDNFSSDTLLLEARHLTIDENGNSLEEPALCSKQGGDGTLGRVGSIQVTVLADAGDAYGGSPAGTGHGLAPAPQRHGLV